MLKLSFMDDRIALNKSNLFAKAFTYWMNNKDTIGEPTFAAIIAAMLNTKKYMLSATVMMTPTGQMRASAAETYWTVIMGTVVTEQDIESMLYIAEYNTRARYFQSAPVQVPRPPPGVRGDFADFEPIAQPVTTVEMAPAGALEPRLEPAPDGIDEAALNVATAIAADPAAAGSGAGGSGVAPTDKPMYQAPGVISGDADDDDDIVDTTPARLPRVGPSAYERIREDLSEWRARKARALPVPDDSE